LGACIFAAENGSERFAVSAAIANAAKAIASLDPAPFNAKLDKSRADIETFQAAIDKATSRQAEIQRTISDMRNEGLLADKMGHTVADALLAGDFDVARRPDTQDLDDELMLLTEGVKELRRRIDGERQAISSTQSSMKAAVGAECIALADELEATAVDLAGQITSIYAATAALASVAPSNVMGNLRRKLAPAVTALCADNNKLTPSGGNIDVPTVIDPILDAIRQFDASMANSMPASVGVPRD
jgi:hypothetical protein